MKPLETQRLYIRDVSFDDAEFVLKLYNDPLFIQNIGDRNIRTIEDAKMYIKNRFLPQIEEKGYGNCTIVLKETQEKIGGVGIFHRPSFKVPDIGFSLLPKFQGKGFAYEAASALLENAKDEFNIQSISALTSKENKASQNLIERLGLLYQKDEYFPETNEYLRYYEAHFNEKRP